MALRVKEMEGVVLDNVLVTAENLSKELHKVRSENEELRQLTVSLNSSSKLIEDESFWQGASWMAEKMNKLTNKLAEQVWNNYTLFLLIEIPQFSSTSQEYQHQMVLDASRTTASPAKITRNHGNFLKGLEKVVNTFQHKVIKAYGKAISALGAAKGDK
jgi:hypothetical protein